MTNLEFNPYRLGIYSWFPTIYNANCQILFQNGRINWEKFISIPSNSITSRNYIPTRCDHAYEKHTSLGPKIDIYNNMQSRSSSSSWRQIEASFC